VRGDGGADPLADLPEVIQLFAAPAQRGRGVGTRLLARVEDDLRREGVASYTVKTLRDDNEATLGFYRQRGFLPRGELVQGGVTYVRLERPLA